MSTTLSSDAETLKKQFYSLETPEDVAKMLDIEYQHLIYYLYRRKREAQYTTVEIPKKSGGVRSLLVPETSLKILQSKLLQVLESVYQPKPSTHGFVKGRGIVTNVEAHFQRKRREFVLNVDIKDFFPSINFGRVRGMFMAMPYNRPKKVATVLAQICCLEKQLPQGAPTSPIITNMICSKLDTQLQRLAREHRCFYTRYADDITFSTSLVSFPRALAQIVDDGAGKQTIPGDTLDKIIKANGFVLNPEKIHLQSTAHRQQITGITVNKLPNVPREYINQIRAMLHAWEKHGYENAEKEHFERWNKSHRSPHSHPTSFAAIVRGKIEYLGMIRGMQNRTYRRFLKKLRELDPSFRKSGLFDMRETIFISYSHKDEEWLEQLKIHLRPLERTHRLVTWDDTKITGGLVWRKEIEKALNFAKAAVLLVTPDFLASDFIAEHELPNLLEAAEKEGLKLLWVAVRFSGYKLTEIEKYQALNDPKNPLASLNSSDVDRVLVEICEQILAEAEK
jgi:RNA-directed DNA polymerase